MAHSASRFFGVPCAVLFIVICGCSGTLPATVTGTVSLDGELLNTGSVTFYSTDGGAAATARILDDGSYTIKTGAKDGLQIGDYQVAVKAVSGAPSPTMTAQQIDALFITPRHYGDPNSSGLSCEITPGANQFDIELVR